jgi:hypothetical protein
MIGRRHKARVNQPNNHSKLTDSNNCTVLFLVTEVIALVRLPPPCVFCRSPSVLLSSIGDRAHVKRVAEPHATYLAANDFYAGVAALSLSFSVFKAEFHGVFEWISPDSALYYFLLSAC